MSMEQYFLYALTLDGVLIDCVSEQSINSGAQATLPILDGLADPKFATVQTVNPQVQVTTQQIAKVLDAMDAIVGDPFAGMTVGNDDVILFMQKQANHGTRETGASHVKIAASTGHIVPQTISAGNDQPGTIRVMANLGALTMTASQSLTGTPVSNTDNASEFYAGPVELNNVALDGVQNITIESGIQLDIKREAGSAAPTFWGIRRRQPVIRISTTNANLIATYQTGVEISASTVVYLRKGDKLGGRVLDATEEHISFTVNAGMIIAPTASGAQQMATIEIHPIYDGTNNPVVVDTATAIV